jgi:CRP/FNR family transcriptional regulator
MIRARSHLLQPSHKLGVLPRGEILYREGDYSASVFFLERGLVKITRSDNWERDGLVRIVGAGELVGERAISSTERRWDNTAIIMADSVVYEYSRNEFFDLCRKYPDLWQWVAQTLYQRLGEIERRMEAIRHYRVQERILLSLAEVAEIVERNIANEGEVSIPLSQEELANLVGATRETTSTSLNELERRGLVQLGRRQVVVRSKALRAAVVESAFATIP